MEDRERGGEEVEDERCERREVGMEASGSVKGREGEKQTDACHRGTRRETMQLVCREGYGGAGTEFTRIE